MTLQTIFRNLELIGERDRLVKIISWRPAIYRYQGRLEVSWPAMLVDCISYRAVSSPVWNWVRIKRLLFGDGLGGGI